MEITFLGTGTSTGVPQIGCHCATCTSKDPNDTRLRASILIKYRDKTLLVDAGPDLRTQLLRAGSPDVDALLVTHSHFDHVGGLIDLRAYCKDRNFPIYCRMNAAREIKQFFPYCFVENLYPGVPKFDIHIIKDLVPFQAEGIEVLPLPIKHYKMDMLGFKIDDFAYITDCKTMPRVTIEILKSIDTLVINALRIEPHMSHLSLSEALDIIEEIGPRRAYLTHMSHHMGPEASVELPPKVRFAHDMLTIKV